MSAPGAPAITIITSTFNAAHELARTARSIESQSYRNFQWIVIDGGSTDGTVEEIRRNAGIIDSWVSERDRGIYDAWNKGCARISGDWVLFIGAGDELARPDTLERCAVELEGAAGTYDIVYGRIQLVSSGGQIMGEFGGPWTEMKGRWGGLLPKLPPHPSSFHHRSLFRGSDSFDASFRYAGDTAFVVQSVVKRDPLYVPIVVDRMLAGGVSARASNILAVAKERRMIARKMRVRPPLLHSIAWHAEVAGQVVFHLLPARIRRALRPSGSSG